MSLRLAMVLTVGFLLAFLVVPFTAYAAMSGAANAMCNPWIPKCGCNKIPGPNGTCIGGKNTYLCPPGICFDTPPGGKVIGICVAANKCEGTSFTDQQGQSQGVGDAKGMMDVLKGVMDMLKQAMQGGGGGGQPPPPPPPPPQSGNLGGASGCTSYYQVTVPSVDPCAYYVPPTSDSLNSLLTTSGSDELLNALNAGSGAGEGALLNVSDALPKLGEVKTSTGTTPPPAPAIGTNLSGEQVNLQSGTRGDIVVTDGGATIVAQARDPGANTEVAGFYGSDTLGGQPQGIVSGMCQSRPWGTSVISFVIPPAFFDSLCAWRGYQVGSPAPPSVPVVEKQATPPAPAPAPAPAPQPQAPTVPPQVEIWAVPDKVSLGTRTSVFWNTRGVSTCSITSPDGSFNEDSLSGGAATVPLSGATTFTISCLTPGGTPVTDYVTVQLTI